MCWYNMDRKGKPDEQTLHAGEPVYVGSFFIFHFAFLLISTTCTHAHANTISLFLAGSLAPPLSVPLCHCVRVPLSLSVFLCMYVSFSLRGSLCVALSARLSLLVSLAALTQCCERPPINALCLCYPILLHRNNPSFKLYCRCAFTDFLSTSSFF